MKMVKSMLEYTKALTVLYVEDDMTLLDSTTELFKNYFKMVDTAADGNEGLERYLAYKKEHDVSYDMVITDDTA